MNVIHGSKFLLLQLLCIVLLLCSGVRANNEIYPATGAAQSAVSWKDGYFYINGKPTFLTSGEMHYARIPRELWRDRIWRSKQMGFNCMQMYVFWNASEPKEGQWDFTDNNDLDAWLTMLQEMGMYATVRVGPYSCAEWDDGGLPAWLLAKPGITLRDGGEFEKYAARELDQVEKIVAKHQIQKGGNVILVQLENEHPKGWGTDDKFPYLKHMVDQARNNGLEIPLFLSGLHHNADPSGEKPYKVGTSPWFSTEFWTGWIGKFGDMDDGMLSEKIRGTWKIIEFGGAGYDYYMVHGGTNFGYSGHTHDATYDYSAPIGESGKFNNFYWHARRAAYLAQSFSPLLTGSHDDPDLAKKIAGGLRVIARTNSTEGSIVFLDNFHQGKGAAWIAPDPSAYKAPAADAGGNIAMRVSVDGAQLPEKGTFTVTPKLPHTVLLNIPWTPNATFSTICSNVMLRQTLGQTDYWVCYGEPGDAGEIRIQRKAAHDLPGTVQFTYPSDDSVQEIELDSGDGHHAVLLVMNTQRTHQTWLAHDKLFIGSEFVSEKDVPEFGPKGGKAVVFSAAGRKEIKQDATSAPEAPALGQWAWRDAAGESDGSFRTDGWLKSTGPREMASYAGFANRYGWYRTTLHADKAGAMAIRFAGKQGTVLAFLNGKPAALDKLDVQAGDNTLAILVKANPRPTLYNVIGSIGMKVAQGLWGNVESESAGVGDSLTHAEWLFHGGLSGLDETPVIGKVTNWNEFLNQTWKSSTPESSERPTLWHTTFSFHHQPAIVQTFGLTTDGLKSGNVWLNGHNLGECPQKIPMYVPECWLKDGANDLVVFDLRGASPEKVKLTVLDTVELHEGE